MSDIRELYQSLILDHGLRPRNFKEMQDSTCIKEGFNPLCGDRLTLFLKLAEERIVDLSFQGCGCAISMASSSLMTEFLQGKTTLEARKIFTDFHRMVTQPENVDEDHLEKLLALRGVSEFPARVKCATLAWHTLIAALDNNPEIVSTE